MRRQLGIVLACCASAASGADPLGPLFFAPEERMQLDRARARGPVKPAAAPPPAAQPNETRISYSGLVLRSDGRSTAWINNRPFDDNDGGAHAAELHTKLQEDGTIAIRSAERGTGVRLKVGQSGELVSGRIAESYMRRVPPREGAAGRPPPIARELPRRRLPEEPDRRRYSDEHDFPRWGKAP